MMGICIAYEQVGGWKEVKSGLKDYKAISQKLQMILSKTWPLKKTRSFKFEDENRPPLKVLSNDNQTYAITS